MQGSLNAHRLLGDHIAAGQQEHQHAAHSSRAVSQRLTCSKQCSLCSSWIAYLNMPMALATVRLRHTAPCILHEAE